jgi:hypothetical protein
MKNKNALYIVLGIGAGVVAYYLFCKKKNEVKASGEPDAKTEDKPTPSKAVAGGGGGIFSPVMPKYVTPVATTTPLVVNVTSTPSTPTPTPTPTATAVTPSKVDVGLVSTPVSTPISTPITRPTLSSELVSKPITLPAPTTTTTMAIATPLKRSSFEGVGQQCFEVGECLHDL